jgi:nucleotide-binding universal stress UspA family protein
VLVHVPADIAAPGHALADVMESQLLEERSRDAAYLEDLLKRLAPAGLTLRPALLRGRVAEALARYVQDHGIEVVVMTTHGRGGLQRAWLGSTADSMIRQCRVPLLLIRPSDETRATGPASERVFGTLLAALDGSEAAERALLDALRLGTTRDARIILLHVLQPSVAAASPYLPYTIQLTPDEMTAREAFQRSYLEGVAGWPELQGRQVEIRLVVDYEPAAAILDMSAAAAADLIVMGTHARGGLRRVLLGSVADRVIRNTARAVLVHRGSGGLARLGRMLARPQKQEAVGASTER